MVVVDEIIKGLSSNHNYPDPEVEEWKGQVTGVMFMCLFHSCTQYKSFLRMISARRRDPKTEAAVFYNLFSEDHTITCATF